MTSIVPVTLTSFVSRGSAIDLATEASAASWNTTSTPVKRTVERERLQDAAFDEGNPVHDRVQAGDLPARKVIENTHLVIPLEERTHEVVTDEARSAGDEGLHRAKV